MKLIIDIPEELYNGIECRNPELETEYVCHELMKAVDNGTPLDDVKAEIKKECDIEAQNHDTFDDYSDGRYDAFSACLKIIDKYMRGKAESEDRE